MKSLFALFIVFSFNIYSFSQIESKVLKGKFSGYEKKYQQDYIKFKPNGTGVMKVSNGNLFPGTGKYKFTWSITTISEYAQIGMFYRYDQLVINYSASSLFGSSRATVFFDIERSSSDSSIKLLDDSKVQFIQK